MHRGPNFFKFFSAFVVFYCVLMVVKWYYYGFSLDFPREIDGVIVETVSDFILWGSKITADGDCSHEIKRCLLLGRKVITNLDSIL